MTTSGDQANPLSGLSREELMSAFFANLVFQQTNMALLMMGKVPHPETGHREVDLEAAQMMIGQLEMLEAKTRGNLDAHEERLLKESLTAVRMAFVEAVDGGAASSPAPPPPATGAASVTSPPPAPSPDSVTPGPEADDSKKKFTKKY